MKEDEKDTLFTKTFKKLLRYCIKFYVDKYKIMKNHLLITASYLDIRTKLFSKFSDAEKKEFLSIAKTKIRSMIENFSSELKNSLNITDTIETKSSINQTSHLSSSSGLKEKKINSKFSISTKSTSMKNHM